MLLKYLILVSILNSSFIYVTTLIYSPNSMSAAEHMVLAVGFGLWHGLKSWLCHLGSV